MTWIYLCASDIPMTRMNIICFVGFNVGYISDVYLLTVNCSAVLTLESTSTNTKTFPSKQPAMTFLRVLTLWVHSYGFVFECFYQSNPDFASAKRICPTPCSKSSLPILSAWSFLHYVKHLSCDNNQIFLKLN